MIRFGAICKIENRTSLMENEFSVVKITRFLLWVHFTNNKIIIVKYEEELNNIEYKSITK